MSQKDDYKRGEDEDSSPTLDAGKLFYELGSHIGRYKLLSESPGRRWFEECHNILSYKEQ